jgi:hypothetical protein
MRAVLTWTKANIQAFGGDPDNVILWGESAGASAVTAHLVAQKSFGLYSKAIMESGAFNTWAYRKWKHANLNSLVIAREVNCTIGEHVASVHPPLLRFAFISLHCSLLYLPALLPPPSSLPHRAFSYLSYVFVVYTHSKISSEVLSMSAVLNHLIRWSCFMSATMHSAPIARLSHPTVTR